jgi:hypothetical protein
LAIIDIPNSISIEGTKKSRSLDFILIGGNEILKCFTSLLAGCFRKMKGNRLLPYCIVPASPIFSTFSSFTNSQLNYPALQAG